MVFSFNGLFELICLSCFRVWVLPEELWNWIVRHHVQDDRGRLQPLTSEIERVSIYLLTLSFYGAIRAV